MKSKRLDTYADIRFKTEEEFLCTIGPDWRRKVGFINAMDYLLGKKVKLGEIKFSEWLGSFCYRDKGGDGWLVTYEMFIETSSSTRIIVKPCTCGGGCSKCVEGIIEKEIDTDSNEPVFTL